MTMSALHPIADLEESARTALLGELQPRKVEALGGTERHARLDGHTGRIHKRRATQGPRALIPVYGMSVRSSFPGRGT